MPLFEPSECPPPSPFCCRKDARASASRPPSGRTVTLQKLSRRRFFCFRSPAVHSSSETGKQTGGSSNEITSRSTARHERRSSEGRRAEEAWYDAARLYRPRAGHRVAAEPFVADSGRSHAGELGDGVPEIDELPADAAAGIASDGYDIVAISALTARILEAYEIADQLREAGVTVVMGGLHVTAASGGSPCSRGRRRRGRSRAASAGVALRLRKRRHAFPVFVHG